jgi:hypothetical protein
LDKVEADLRASGIHFVTLTTSDSASYRLEHVLDWMDKALEPWSEGRELRLLLCDAYSAHDDEAVRRLAWSKGYIVLYVGGGTTGAVQTNDTHLHRFLDEQYTELEQMSLLDDGELEPNRLQARTREECILDIVSIWNNRALHVRASGGYKADGLLLAMDETEDGLVTGDAGDVFRTENIPELRRLAVQDMCDLFESGEAEITYEFFYGRLIEPFPKRGQLDQYREGQDDEGHDDDAEGGKLYNANDDDDAASSAASENNAEAMKAALDELRDADFGQAEAIDPEDANAVGEARNKALGAVDVMLRAAEQLHDPGLLQALETMQRKLVKASKRQTKDEIGLSLSLRSAEALKTASLKKAQTFIAKTMKI